ncbi:uncharacterized protein CEXT_186871 [Caerostris extrusa]|uniref:Uncharacterized protein n=1 Tax=Caerostris extrusa TaxID=172846 RepID=A0AAV4X8V0_CAEEX|nr:uncharacterized protein CEXT_186871 [Caerostris extrusa]
MNCEASMRWRHRARRGRGPFRGARMVPVGPPVTMVHGILSFLDQERSRHGDRIRLWKRRLLRFSSFQRRHFPNPGKISSLSLSERKEGFLSFGKTGPRFRNWGIEQR